MDDSHHRRLSARAAGTHTHQHLSHQHSSTKPAYTSTKSFAWKDGRASVEQHIGLLLEDLSKLGSQSSVSAAEDMVLREAFLGLHYVWRMRVHDNLNELSRELMDRLRLALLLFTGRVLLKGPPFLARSIPTREAVFAFVIFCGMVRDCSTFREAVNDNMTVAEIKRALAVHQVW